MQLTSVKSREIKASIPVRISFFGGGTDVPIYFEKNKGCVLSTTINRFLKIRLRQEKSINGVKIHLSQYKKTIICTNKDKVIQKDPFDLVRATLTFCGNPSGIAIDIESDISPGSGLGTSSATVVGLLGVLYTYIGKSFSKQNLASDAVIVERDVLGISGGLQDQYAVAFGGFNFFTFSFNRQVLIEQLELSKVTKEKLRQNLLLYYIGGARSEEKQQQAFVSTMKTNSSSYQALHKLKRISHQMKKALLKGDLSKFGSQLHASWLLKQKTNPAVSNPRIDQVYNTALNEGIIGGKLLGSGGGGCLLFFCPKAKQKKVIKALAKFGGYRLPFAFEKKGAVIS